MRSALLIVLCLVPAVAWAEDRSGVRPEVLSLPSGPGSVQGLGASFEPSTNTGTASYSVPLELPPGVRGFVPELALHYASSTGNGELGIGWTLGLPEVARSTDHGLPKYDSSDVITLGGMGSGNDELVKLADGSYRFRIEGAFVRGRQRQDGSWEFYNRSGVRFRFGQRGARVAEGDRTYRWLLTEQVDTLGHVISYEYEVTAGQIPRVGRIVYNDFSAAVRNEVVFHWEARADALTSYLPGFSVSSTKRVQSIEVKHGGETIRTYALGYETLLGLSRLSIVDVTGRDGETRLPTLRFAYAGFDPSSAHMVEMEDAPARALGEASEISDVDGDALPDLLVMDPSIEGGRYRWYPNLDGASFGKAVSMETSPSVWLENAGVQLADMDGDAIADVVAKLSGTEDGFRFYPGSERGFAAAKRISSTSSFSFEDADVRLVDLDHDRRTDWLRIDPTTGDASAAFNAGAGQFGQTAALARIDASEVLAFSRGLQLADMNGDGLPDLVAVRSQSVRYWPGQGRGQFDVVEKLEDAPTLADRESAQLQVRDLNGDGLADLLLVGVSELRYWLNLAGARVAPAMAIPVPPMSPSATVRVADMNGNGTADIVWVDPTADVPWRYLDLLPEGTPGLLTRIDNGLGKVVSIEYTGLGEMRAWERTQDVKRAGRSPVGQTVLRAVTVSDSMEWRTRTEYRYAAGYFDPGRREFRGFQLSETRELGDEEQPTLITRRLTDVGAEDAAKKGLIESIERQTDAGFVFDHIDQTSTVRTLEVAADGTAVRFAFVSRVDTAIIEGSSVPRLTRTETDYDAFGNVTLEADYGELCGEDPACGRDEKITRSSYALNETAWILDRKATERTETLLGERVAETRNYYDGKPFEGLALHEVGRGLVSRVESWVEDERFATEQRCEYDAHGNAITLLNARGGKREVAYDPEAHTQPIREIQYATADDSLAWHVNEYDLALGVVLEVRGPNADVTRFQYDALGRATAMVEEGDSPELPTRSFHYELAAPTSTIREETREQSGQAGTLTSVTRLDGLGRPLGSAKEGSQTEEWAHQDMVSYGARGWPAKRGLPVFGRATDSPAGWKETATSLTYDGVGRERTTRALDGSETRTEYHPLSREVWDENDSDPSSPHYGTFSSYVEDGLGQVRSVIEREGPRTITTARYDFDALGNLVRAEDAEGRVRSYAFDGRSRLVRIDDPNAGVWRQTWTDADDLETRRDSTGRSVRFGYDTLGRVLEEWHTLPNVAEQRVTHYHYDHSSAAHPELANVAGRLAWVEDAAGSVFFGYTPRGLTARRVRRWSDGREHTSFTEFDAADRVAKRGFPDGSYLAHHYDARGLLRMLGPIARQITYTAAGQLQRIELGNGVVDQRHYDARQRLQRMEATTGNRVFRDLQLELDNASRITGLVDLRPDVDPLTSLSAAYTFDDRYRLLATRDSAGTTSWSYDAVANIRSVVSDHADAALNVTNTYGENGAGPDQITHHGGAAVQYDAAGRVVDDGQRKLTWDAKGRLARVESANNVEEYVYAFDDARAWKRTGKGGATEEVRYIDHDAEERNGKLVRYAFIGPQRVARLDALTGDSANARSPNSCAAVPGSSRPHWSWLGLVPLIALLALRRRVLTTALSMLGVLALSCTPSSGVAGVGIEQLPAGAAFYISDHQDTPVALLDAQGAVVEEYVQHAYGSERIGGGKEPWSFVGNELDASDLGNFHARPYDALLGRFLAVDPEPLFEPSPKSPLAFQAYTYGAGDPVNQADPSGRSIWTKVLKVGVKLWKTGSAVQAFADNIQDGMTVVDNDAPALDRVIAGVSLASELLPVSIGDAKDATRLIAAATSGAVSRVKGAVERGAAAYRAAKETARANRKVYNQVADELGQVAKRLHAGGMSAENVVRAVSPARNELKMNIRERGSAVLARLAGWRNQLKYGNPAGPSPDDLYARAGSWEAAMAKISKTNAKINKALGAEK